MLRAIASVIVGYIVMFIVVFITLTAAYLLVGTDRAFKAGSYDVSMMWIIVSSVLGLIAAALGGWVAALIAQTSTPPKVLAALVLIFGLLMAVPAFMSSEEPAPAVRTAEVGNMEAMMSAKTPPLAAVLNPLLGAVGVLIGASFVKRSARSSA